MRKFIAVILGLILTTSAGYALRTEGDLIEQLFDEANVEVYDFTPEALKDLSQSGDPFKNLYLFMYQNVKIYPREKAIEVVANQTVYSEEEVELMVLDGDFSPLYDYYEEIVKVATQEELGRDYIIIQGLYAEELRFQLENYTLSYEAVAQEIFMNGDTTDSANIDLLYDLDIIHFLLFGDFLQPEDRSGDQAVILSSEDLYKQRRDEIILAAEEDESDEEETFNPLICTEDSDLRDALDEFEDFLATLPEEELREAPVPEPLIEEILGEEEEEFEEEVFALGPRSIPEREPLEDFLQSIETSNGKWNRELPCNEIFCIKVNLVTQSGNEDHAEEKHEPTENCISCHLGFILERMEQVLDKPLVARKVPMNFGEEGTCKKAGKGVQIDLNVYLVKKPILLDPGDNIEEIPGENTEDFKKNLISIGALPLPGVRPLRGKTPDDIDFENLVYFKCKGTQEECQIDAIERQAVRAQEVQDAFDTFILKARAENNHVLYEQLAAELQKFGTYFLSFQSALKDTYLQNDPPLTDLLNKKYCT